MFAPNVYLVVYQALGALIDAGHGDEQAAQARIAYVRNLNCRLRYIVLTHAHRDHIGGAKLIRENTGAEITAHAAEVGRATITVDRIVGDGDMLSLNEARLEVIHTPGHSPGHICIYLREERILFSGDQILGTGTTALRPPEGDMAVYIDSLRKLLNYEIVLICPGHGPPIRDPKRKIQELIQHRLEREEQVLAGIRQRKVTVRALVEAIYPELDRRLFFAAEGQVLAHLIKLEREGVVSSTGGDDEITYSIN